MPIYEYECPVCHNKQDEMKPIADRGDCPPCSACGSITSRLVSKSDFTLKGRGWSGDGYSYPSPRDKASLV